MGDIDLIMELRGDQPVNAKLRQTAASVATVEKATAQSTKLFGVFNTQLNNGAVASGLARMGFTELGASLSALPLLLNPVTLGITAFTGLAAVIYKTAEASRKQKEEKLAEELKRIEAAANQAATGLHAYWKAIAGGASEKDAESARASSQAMSDFEKKQKDIELAMKRTLAFIEQSRAKQAELRRDGVTGAEAVELGRLEIAIENAAAAMAHLVEMQDENARAAGNVIGGLKGETDWLKDLGNEYDNAATRAAVLAKIQKQMDDAEAKRRAVQAAVAARKRDDPYGFGEAGVVFPAVPEEDEFTIRMRLRAEAIESLGIASGKTAEEVAVSLMRIEEASKQALLGGAVGAFDAYADALDETVALNQIFAAGFDRAMRNVLASTLRSIGQQATVEAMMEFAKAVRDFADGNAVGGAGHLKAGGMFLGVAAVAGAAAGAASVSPAGGRGGGAGERVSGGGGSREGQSGGGPNIQVTVIGNLDASSRESLVRQLQEEISRRDL